MTAALLSIGTAVPGVALNVEGAIELATTLNGAARTHAMIAGLHRRCEVEHRGSAILSVGGAQDLYAPGPNAHGPTTADRLARYLPAACDLACAASADALARAEVKPVRVTHLVTASCTGFDAPGVDQAIMRRLGLRPSIRRTHIGFMGCHAAINALAVASAYAAADLDAVVLVCAVELCSLHYHFSGRMDQLIANALFADGAAAAVVSSHAPKVAPRLEGFFSEIFEGSGSEMSWTIGDHGFEMTLAPTIPESLSAHVPAWVAGALERHHLNKEDIGAWAIHPGGPRIVRCVVEALGLPASSAQASLAVLREHGNMSSPTVLFILREQWERGIARPWVALAFGPGIAGEGIVIG